MKLMFCALPAYGHMYPLMPMADAARDAGHDVTFATTGLFRTKLAGLGYATFDAGLTIDDAVAEVAASTPQDGMPKTDDGRPDLDSGGRLFLEVLAPRNAADLLAVLREHTPDLVIYEQYDMGAAVAAGVAGLPAVAHAISPRLPAEVVALVTGDRLDRLWASYGMTAPFDALTGMAYLDLIPTVLQQRQFLSDPARMVVRPVPWAEPGTGLPSWIGEGARPLIYLTLGTIVATDDVLLPAIEGLSGLDADVLVALGSAAGRDLGPLPANVHVEPFVDQAALLPHADLVVHHGGTGTTLGALAHGKPQILLPKGADQFFNADAVAAAGLATVLEPAEATPEAVAMAAKEALEEARPAAIGAVQAEIAAMPHPAEVLALLVARYA